MKLTIQTKALTGECGRYIDLLATHTETLAGGHEEVAIVERIDQVWQAAIGSW